MPPPPEGLHRGGPIRLVEVAREGIAQQGCDPDGHVRIGREVAVDLDRIGIDRRRYVDRPIGRRIEEDRIHQPRRQLGRDHRLLEQAPDDQQQPMGRHLARQPGHTRELRQQVRRPHDGPRHQMGEEAHQQHDVQQALGRRRLAAIDVDHIADALEGEEADPHRQHHLQQGEVPFPTELGKQINSLFDEEAVILEEAQDGQIGGHAQADPQFAPTRLVAAHDQGRHAPVQHGRGDQQPHEPPVPLGVEEPAGQQQEQFAPPVLPIQAPADQIDEQEEDREGQGRKQHQSVSPLAAVQRS